ncbi:MAG: hypothetical protein ABIR70_21900 [Bryobacteraceae bacterium]
MPKFLWLLLCLLPVSRAADWQPWGPFGGSVISIAVDPSEPSHLLAGARNGQLFHSSDHGSSWSQLSFGRNLSGTVRVIAIDPSVKGHYWVGISAEQEASNGLWESRDAGQSWMQHLSGLAVESLALFSGTIAAGTRHGLYRTIDGEHWDRITPEHHSDLEDIVSVAFDPTDAKTLYAGTPHLPWKTTDGGKTWMAIHTGMIDDSDVFSIHVSASAPTQVFASACSGIYRSRNAGGRWALLQGIPKSSRRTHVIVQHPANPQMVFAGTTSGLFRSTDGGTRWTKLNSLAVNAIAFDPAKPNTMYLATELAGVQISTDSGVKVQPSNEGLHARNIRASASFGSLQFLSTAYEGSQGGLYIHSAAGWRKLGAATFSSDNIQSVAVSDGRLLVSTDQRILQSKDFGRTWTRLPTQPPGRGLKVAIGWAGSDRGLFRLTGATWKKAVTTTAPVRGIRTAGKQVIAWTNQSAHVSPDDGKSWRNIPATGLFSAAASCDGSVLLAMSDGVSVALPGAAPIVTQGIPPGTVSAVAFDGFRCEQAYAVQFGKLYQSTDRGLHWSAVDGPRTLSDISDLWVSSSGDDSLFAVVPGAGVFRLSAR